MAEVIEKGLKKIGITVSKPVLAIVCIIFGIILIVGRDFAVWLVALIIGLFLVIQGILILTDYFELKKSPAS